MNYHSLPRLDDSITFLYVEHAVIDKRDESIEIIRKMWDGSGVERVPVPIAKTTSLVLGPGTTITHAAIGVIAEVGCSCVWSGEQMRKFYAFGSGETNSSKNLLEQARLCMDETLHLDVVKRMYKKRFPDFSFVEKMTLKQMRGMEGSRMKSIYRVQSARTGVPWNGRRYKPNEIHSSDNINQALTIANSLLYAICQSAIVSMGLSPGLGFIHTGNALSFVYDIADLYKAETTIPASFDATKHYLNKRGDFPAKVRQTCREYFVRENVLQTITQDIGAVLGNDLGKGIERESTTNDLWQKSFQVIKGGTNYAISMSQDDEEEEW